MQCLVKQIGISDVANREALPLGVPFPERGYWNRLQVGKPVTKIRTRLKFLSACTDRSVTKKILIEAKQTAGLRETAHARGKQTGRKKKPRRNT